MKGIICMLRKKSSGENKLPITVTNAVYEDEITQKEINERLSKKSVNPQFYLYNQVCHRGGTNYPENTLPAYSNAIKNGFKYCECDVRVTSDNKFVALHDETIDRTSDGTGNVSSFTYTQLQSYDFGSWKSATFSGTKIPLITQIAMLCKINQVILEIDCAGRLTETQMCALYDELEKIGALGNIVICGYESELEWLYNNGRLNVAVSVSFLNTTPTSTIIGAISPFVNFMAGANVSINKTYLTSDLIAAIKKRGWAVKTWTISSDTEASTYTNMGADTILVNSDTKLNITT